MKLVTILFKDITLFANCTKNNKMNSKFAFSESSLHYNYVIDLTKNIFEKSQVCIFACPAKYRLLLGR